MSTQFFFVLLGSASEFSAFQFSVVKVGDERLDFLLGHVGVVGDVDRLIVDVDDDELRHFRTQTKETGQRVDDVVVVVVVRRGGEETDARILAGFFCIVYLLFRDRHHRFTSLLRIGFVFREIDETGRLVDGAGRVRSEFLNGLRRPREILWKETYRIPCLVSSFLTFPSGSEDTPARPFFVTSFPSGPTTTSKGIPA